MEPAGTPFQRAVWSEIAATGFGQTRTYSDVAAAIGRPRATRAVGGACGRNPVSIVVPCHRIVGADARLRWLENSFPAAPTSLSPVVSHDVGRGILLVLEHLLDQVDASARPVALVTE